MTRWIHRLALVPLSIVAIAAAGVSSAHASCPPQDLVCLAEETADTGQGLADDTVGPIDAPGDETIAPVTDVTDPVLSEIQDRLDEILGEVSVDPPPDPIGGGGGGGTHPSGPGAGYRSNHTNRSDGAAHRRAPGLGPHGSAGPNFASSAEDPSGAVLRDADPASGERFGAAIEGVARSLAIVLALFGLAVGFVSIQDRLDRNDPRLALAPVESDIVEFA
jgi:hypothetical protein